MPEKLINVVKEHINAFSVRDWKRYKDTVVPRFVYEEPATRLRVEGVDPVLKALETWTVAFPDMKGTIKNLLVQDNMVMAEIVWEGTHKGLFKSPLGEIPATGKKGTLNAINLFTFEGDKIREARHYFDLMTILNQLGVPTLPTLAHK